VPLDNNHSQSGCLHTFVDHNFHDNFTKMASSICMQASCLAAVAPAAAVRSARKSSVIRGTKVVVARDAKAARVTGRRTFTTLAATGFSRDLYLSLDEGVGHTQMPGTTDGIAENVFAGNVAERYLKKQGMSLKEFEDPSWVKSVATADKVAAAVLEWAIERGATNWCHWFQPMAAAYRHGQTAQVQNSLLTFGPGGKPSYNFSVRARSHTLYAWIASMMMISATIDRSRRSREAVASRPRVRTHVTHPRGANSRAPTALDAQDAHRL
jgi:hypothetical protein